MYYRMHQLLNHKMAKTFRVGILGNQDEAGMDYFGFKYGVEVFDLTTDQICSLLDNTDASKSVQTAHSDTFPAPVMTYNVMVGGRFYPGVSREELSKAVEGMEVLIAQMSTATSFMGHDFFNTIFSECLSDKCKVVIARIVGPKPTYRTGRSQRQQKTNEFLKIQGLDIERFKYKGKLFIITDKSKAESQDTKKSKGTKVSIGRVRSELAGEELKMAITQPVKESVTAGKAIIGLGARVGRWFSSLIKAH